MRITKIFYNMTSNNKYGTISIYDALENIVENKFILPAIQRKFVWKSEQIEALFDSIMRDYPINTFMLWEIKDSTIKNNYKFYGFLQNYREYFKDENPEVGIKGSRKDYYAVIDGQQRLTSLFIGLKGTYAYKLPRVWWIDCEENLPTRCLYLDLSKEVTDADDERKMKYNFKFLTENEVKKASEKTDSIWFKVSDLCNFGNQEDCFDDFVFSQPWRDNVFARHAIRTLFRKVFREQLITYYLEDTQEIDTVLDIFTRTNRGGEPLSYSNLLMSFITAHWQKDTRAEFKRLCEQIFQIGRPGFMIDSDFILKTCLVLFCRDIKFRMKNFKADTVSEIEENWERIGKSIKEAFKLIENWGFNYSNMKAMNAVIPLVYYIFIHKIEDTINNPLQHKETKEEMRRWFCVSLLKRVFGGQSDAVLVGIRRVLDDKKTERGFPFNDIKEAFRENPSKNLSFDEEFINGLLGLHKDNSSCYPVMALIYSHLDYGNQTYHLDHLHPAAYFMNLKKEDGMSEEEYSYYKDPENWDTIPNLQMLNGILNESKNDTPLAEWIEKVKIKYNYDLDNQLIPMNVSLDVKDFKEFIVRRKAMMKERLMTIVK